MGIGWPFALLNWHCWKEYLQAVGHSRKGCFQRGCCTSALNMFGATAAKLRGVLKLTDRSEMIRLHLHALENHLLSYSKGGGKGETQ